MASLSEGAFAECEYLPRRNRQDQRFPCAGYECKKTPSAVAPQPDRPLSAGVLRLTDDF